MKYILFSFIFIFSFLSLEARIHPKPKNPDTTISVNEIIQGGKYLKLSDGSYWEIEPDAVPLTGSWLLAPTITITKSPDPAYPYHLTNTTSNTTVLAKKIDQAKIPKEVIQPPTQRDVTKPPAVKPTPQPAK